MSFQDHLQSAQDLVTPYEEVRAGFIKLALEKNRQATPFIDEAKTLKALASQITKPADLLMIDELRPAILTAAGISDKARKYLTNADQFEAIKGLVDNFLEPAGRNFVDELVFRFLLTRGDTLGGRMRNLAGILAEYKVTRKILSTLSLQAKQFSWLNVETRTWHSGSTSAPDIERSIRGLYWESKQQQRTLVYNLNVPVAPMSTGKPPTQRSLGLEMPLPPVVMHHTPSSSVRRLHRLWRKKYFCNSSMGRWPMRLI